jgi:hypothetical protein
VVWKKCKEWNDLVAVGEMVLLELQRRKQKVQGCRATRREEDGEKMKQGRPREKIRKRDGRKTKNVIQTIVNEE